MSANAFRSGEAQLRYAEAAPPYWRALEICESQLGPDHPDTATSLNNGLLGVGFDQRLGVETCGPSRVEVGRPRHNPEKIMTASLRPGNIVAW